MTTLGVFRDDFYNAVSVLSTGQFKTTAQGNGTVLPASSISGASENYVAVTVATALTFDSAANVIAYLQQAVAAAFQAQTSGGVSNISPPPPGVPNLFNLSFMVYVRSTGALTLTLGAGMTLGNGLLTVGAGVERQYMFTVTGPNSLTINDLGGAAVT